MNFIINNNSSNTNNNFFRSELNLYIQEIK